MARVSPLRTLHQQAEASLALYGPPEAGVRLVETFGELELEYAALRKSCVLLDQPHRGVLGVTGRDRLEFLNRMVTQELKGLEPFQSRRSFWLNRKGRIEADLRIVELGERMLVDLDVHAAERTLKSLEAFVIAEDVRLEDATERLHRFALHGPGAAALLARLSRPVAGPPLGDLGEGRACVISLAGHEVVVDSDAAAGEIGLELTLAVEAAAPVYEQLLEAGHTHNGDGGPGAAPTLRPAGWHAFNIARIEAGRPLFNLDFGPDSLPHETGVLRERVSFTKGCYLGQEVVARMDSRGHSKRTLVALRFDQSQTRTSLGEPRQPVTGSHVWGAKEPEGDPVGAVTSSTLSPMLGGEPICFAAVKPGFSEPGAHLLVAADDAKLPATVQPRLAFWVRP
ncbi:MAG: glycine cleavage T C-terminal barrel domain-containing protein [Phycisphaerales bacterium]